MREDLWVRDGVIIDPQDLFWGEKGQVDALSHSLPLHLPSFLPRYVDIFTYSYKRPCVRIPMFS